MFMTRWAATFLVGFFLVLGCGGGGDPAAPPSGWQSADSRWWSEDVDSSEVFRDLDSLSAMGVTGTATMSPGGTVTQEQFQGAIKRSLVRLYRNNPTVIDSLFEEYASPQLEGVDLSGQVVGENGQLKSKILDKNQKTAYEAITEYYREPQRQEDASLQYPDSLRQSEEASGEVELQVHIDSTGSVNAVEVLEGVHPTLDAIAMRAATQTVWEPAYVLRDGEWRPQHAWARFSVNYPAPR